MPEQRTQWTAPAVRPITGVEDARLGSGVPADGIQSYGSSIG